MKKPLSILRFMVRRLLTLLSIAIKALCFVPILLFMVWFNYTVDISGLFQGELAPREICNLLLEGKTVANYDQMDERAVLELYVQNLSKEQVPTTLAIGSSRVMQLTKEIAGDASFFNAGMSGAGLMDVINAFYLFDRADKLPQTLIFEVDPWLFNGVSSQDLNKRADSELFAEFLQLCLGRDTGYEAPNQLEHWKALLDPSYFQGNVRYFLKQKQEQAAAGSQASDSPFFAVDMSQIDDLSYTVKRPDGSIYYQKDFRNWTYDQMMAEVLAQAGTIQQMHGFDSMDPYWTQIFEEFVAYVQSRGVKVIFLLTPYHPFVLKHVANNPQGLEGFFQVEPWLRQFAQEHNIPLYGSYHASRVGIQEWLFFDGIHCKGEALRLMFPGVEAALQGQQTAYQQEYLNRYGKEYPALVEQATVGTTADCLVVDENWFLQAQADTGLGTPYAADFDQDAIEAQTSQGDSP